MGNHNPNNSELLEELGDKPFDDLKNLYIGHIDEVVAVINREKFRLEGEVLFYGYVEDNVFKVERLRRVALYGSHQEPVIEKDHIGLISLVGPLYDNMRVEPGPPAYIDNLGLQLHYRALTYLDPPPASHQSEFPTVEEMIAGVTLEWTGELIETEVQMKLEFTSKLIDNTRRAGLVNEIAFEAPQISCYLAKTGTLGNPFQGFCEKPPATCGSPFQTVVRGLPLKIINVSDRSLGSLQTGIENQIGGVCEVWWNQAALNLTEAPPIDDASTLTDENNISYNTVDLNTQLTLPGDYTKSITFPPSTTPLPPHYVEVYLVNTISYPNNGGGVTLSRAQASAYIILAVEGPDPLTNLLVGSDNRYRLAHEIGHVLGLEDAGGGGIAGNFGSVMQAGLNSDKNTLWNCQIFTTWPDPLNNPNHLTAICRHTHDPDCFQPKP